jgi:hypothetical protein
VNFLANRRSNTYILYNNNNNGHETKNSSISSHKYEVGQIIGSTHPLIYLKQMVLHIHIIVVLTSIKHLIVLHIINDKHFTL